MPSQAHETGAGDRPSLESDARRRYRFPKDLLPGCLSLAHRRCGKPTCHCAQGEGHPVWILGFMSGGRHRVERIPLEWVDDVRRRVEAGRAFQDALRAYLAANAEFLVLRRKRHARKGERVLKAG